MSLATAAAMLLTGTALQAATPSASPVTLYHSPPQALAIRQFVPALEPVVTSAPAPLPRALRPVRRAASNLQAWISADDHPARAMRDAHDGMVSFRLDVNPAGRVDTCTIIVSSGSPALDHAACRIFRARPRFAPALMRDGSFGPDIILGTVRWRLREDKGRAGVPVAPVPVRPLTRAYGMVTQADYPSGAPPSFMGASQLRVAIGRTGRVIGCEIATSSGSALFDAAACPLYAARMRFTPARNAAGAAVCDVIWDAVGWGGPAAATPRARRRPAARLPGPLRAQLRGRHCPGWSPN